MNVLEYFNQPPELRSRPCPRPRSSALPRRRGRGRFSSAGLYLLAAGLMVQVLTGQPASAANPGDEVIVLYNSRLPESKSLAEYYASKRQVPTNQIFGFAVSTEDDISRTEYRDSLEKPLAKLLESRDLWHIRSVMVP